MTLRENLEHVSSALTGSSVKEQTNILCVPKYTLLAVHYFTKRGEGSAETVSVFCFAQERRKDVKNLFLSFRSEKPPRALGTAEET